MNNEQVKDVTSAEEMRAEINRLRRDVSLVRLVMDTADYNGLSAEDRYTLLAYHALKESQKYKQLSLQQLQTVAHPFVVSDLAHAH